MSPEPTPSFRILGSGPLLIYLAGVDGTGDLFFKQAPELARKYRVVTFRSRDGRGFTYEDLAADVAAIVRGLGESRATIVGESFGGTVALGFALGFPSMVERLVIVNSFPRFRRRVKLHLARLTTRLPLRLVRPLRMTANLLGLYLDGVTAEDRRRFFDAMRNVGRDSYARRLDLIAGLDVEHRLHEINVPVLFVAGDRDIVVPSQKEALRMAARVQNARIVIVRGAGHACLMGSHVNLAQLLDEWKRGH